MTVTITRRDALRVAADVLARSDWLTVDLLADDDDENANENAEAIVTILRTMATEAGQAAEMVGEDVSVVWALESLRTAGIALLAAKEDTLALCSTKEDRADQLAERERAAAEGRAIDAAIKDGRLPLR